MHVRPQGTLMLTWMAPLVCIIIILTFIPPATEKVSKDTSKEKAGQH